MEIEIIKDRVCRCDAAIVIGADIAKFAALKFDEPGTDWQDHLLSLPPTLVIESVSTGHEAHDRQTKRRWYADFGIRNYWIVDGYKKSLEFLSLERGAYRIDGAGTNDDTIAPSAFAGLQIPLPQLWRGDIGKR